MIIGMITDTIFMLCGVDCWSEKSRIAPLFVQIYAGELALDSVFVCLWTLSVWTLYCRLDTTQCNSMLLNLLVGLFVCLLSTNNIRRHSIFASHSIESAAHNVSHSSTLLSDSIIPYLAGFILATIILILFGYASPYIYLLNAHAAIRRVFLFML